VGKLREQHPAAQLRVTPAIGDAPEILQASMRLGVARR